MMILVDGTASLIAVQASMPPRLGMRTSMRTMSGVVSTALCTASAPSSASPTTSMSGSCSSTISSPRRNSAWSSTTSTRIGSPVPGGTGGMPPPSAVSLTLASMTGSDGVGTTCHDGTSGLLRRAVWAKPSGGGVTPCDEPDHAIVIAPSAVHHARHGGVGVDEQEEVVADELHLEKCLVERHRYGGVDLLPHDERRRLLLRVHRRRRRGGRTVQRAVDRHRGRGCGH